MATHTVKRNDTSQAWTDTLTLNGSAINLVGCTVKLIISHEHGTVVSWSATVVSAAAGTVSYQPVTADVATAETLKLEWEITYPDLTVLTVPNDSYITLKIIPDLNPT